MKTLRAATPEYVGELVRCKDCKYLRTYGGVRGGHYCARNIERVEAGDFCSHAEKRED